MKSLVSNKGMAFAAFALLAIVCCAASVYPKTFPVPDKPYDAAMIGNIAWMLVATRHARHG